MGSFPRKEPCVVSLSRYLCRVIRIPTAAEPLMKSPPFPKGDVCGADRGILLEMPRADPWPFGPLHLSSPPWGAPSQGRSLLLRQHHVICVESLGFLPPLAANAPPLSASLTSPPKGATRHGPAALSSVSISYPHPGEPLPRGSGRTDFVGTPGD